MLRERRRLLVVLKMISFVTSSQEKKNTAKWNWSVSGEKADRFRSIYLKERRLYFLERLHLASGIIACIGHALENLRQSGTS